MAKNSKSRNDTRSLADPSRLKPHDPDDKDILQVIIETPKGSRNKYAFDPEQEVFQLKKVLPAGMAFPYDFGFIPSTIGGDGDPIDVLVLMDEPAFPGCLLKCRIIGVIEGEEGEKNEMVRNDRVVAIEQENHSWANVKKISDLGKKFLKELEVFFENYHELDKEDYRCLGVKGPAQARKLIKKGSTKTKN